MKTKIRNCAVRAGCRRRSCPGRGCDAPDLTSIEVGKYTASLPLAHKLARYFGLAIEDVFDFSDLDGEE